MKLVTKHSCIQTHTSLTAMHHMKYATGAPKRRRFDVIMTLLLRRVSTGTLPNMGIDGYRYHVNAHRTVFDQRKKQRRQKVWISYRMQGSFSTNERQRYIITPALIGWAQTYNDPWDVLEFNGHPMPSECISHDDNIKWKHIPRYWPFVWGIHRSPMNSLHKGQWRGALMFSLICAWFNGVNNREAGDLRRYRAQYDVIVVWFARTHMTPNLQTLCTWCSLDV